MPLVKLHQYRIMYADLVKTDVHHTLCTFWATEGEGLPDEEAIYSYENRKDLLKLLMAGRYVWVEATGQTIEDEV